MSYEFFPPSNKALQSMGQFVAKHPIPWNDIPVGMSYQVPQNSIGLNVLRTTATRTGKKLNKQFRVLDHGDGLYEVFYVGPRDENEVQNEKVKVEKVEETEPVKIDPVYPNGWTPPTEPYVDDPKLSNAENMKRAAERFMVKPGEKFVPPADWKPRTLTDEELRDI